LSNITISHYEGEAVRDNLQSNCSLGENPCTIEVYWSWPAPMIAVQNDGAAITDFSILVAKVGGAHLSEGTFDVGILLDLDVMHDGQVGFADDPEDYFSYYEVNNLGQSGELTVSITDVVGGISDDLLIEYYEDGMYVDECDQGELTCSITISSSWVLPMVTVVNMGFDQTNYGITVGTGGGSGGTTGGLPLSGSITDLEPGEFQYHETNFIVPAGDGSGFYLHISDATGNALIQPAVECYYEDEWWNYTWENCTDSLFGDGSCNLDYLWEGEECRVGFYNEDLIESIGFDFEINTIP
ncbi:MAG: hypothetical protein GY866_30495, partial [Proteobacteria bacterium]|nr:hypothetical protein [Pseudomonadota bacterium]